jgi:uncharacterized protein (DUF305 family)
MKRRQRFLIAVVAALLAATVGIGGVALARGAEALPWRAAPAATSNDPFRGVADPSVPYELRFLDAMIMHHEGAIMSARGMIANSSRPELRDLARRIIAGQQRQVDQMRAWRQRWYPDAPASVGGMGGMMGGGMMGGNGAGMMGGDGTDRMFLRMMIPHHQLAIDMARDALTNAQHDELKGLAREIIVGQSAEITEMEGYLRAWYGEASTRDAGGAMRDGYR